MEIHWVHFEALSAEQRDAVEGRIRQLAAGHDDLIDVRLVARSTGHHRHGNQEVRIAAQARGEELVAARTREELGQALDECLDAFTREVHRLRDRRRDRRSEAPGGPPERGIVDRLLTDEGYGFILTDAGEQVYFHRNAVKHGLRFEELDEGRRVALNFEAGEHGLQATVVAPVPSGAPTP